MSLVPLVLVAGGGAAPRGFEPLLKLKVCLLGEEAVGKASLVRRFVSGTFDEAYTPTLGVVASKRSVELGTTRKAP